MAEAGCVGHEDRAHVSWHLVGLVLDPFLGLQCC